MSTCPTCGCTYSARVSFCFDDGTPLVGEPDVAEAPPVKRAATPPVPLPRRGRSLLARRRGGPAPAPEHTDFGSAGYSPRALEPMAVARRNRVTLDPNRTPPSPAPRPRSGGRPPELVQSAPPVRAPTPVAATPTPVPTPAPGSAPPIRHPPANPTMVPEAPLEPMSPQPVKPSEAPTIIREPDDDDSAGWGLMLTVLLGVGGVVLVGLSIAAVLVYMNDSDGPQIAVNTEVPAPSQTNATAPKPAPVVAPEPVVEPVAVEGADAGLVDPDAIDPQPVVEPAPEPVVEPAPGIVIEPLPPEPEPVPVAPAPVSPASGIVVTPSPEPRPVEPESVWTTVEPEPFVQPNPPISERLTVNSTPTGAAVYINGVNLGSTPFSMTVPIGNYPVELRLEGYENISQTIRMLDSMGSRIDVRLVPIARSGPVTITTGAAWFGAELFVDGRSSGTVPASLSSLSEGSHTFVLRLNGNEETFTRTVQLNRTGMTVLNLGG